MKSVFYLAATAIAICSLGCVNRDAQKQARATEELLANKTVPVEVMTATPTTMQEQLEVTGSISTSDDVTVGAKVGGKITQVFVKEGDSVTAGQPLAQLDTTNAQLALQQAQAQVASAQANLNQAVANATVGPARTASAVAAAQAQLRSAKSQLLKSQNGARPEEKAQAQNNVAAARSAMETAKKDLERKRALYADGAISKQQLDIAENAYQGSLSQYENAIQAQQIIQNAVRPEDLATAQEAVRQAEEGLRTALANKRLDVLLVQQVDSAKAALQAAKAQVSLAKQNIADATVRAPFSGRISGNPAQPGVVVAPGSPVARIVSGSAAYFDGELPESALGKIRAGMPVSVVFDSLSGLTVEGKIASINPTISTVGRLASVRVEIPSGNNQIKPGMFARGQILIRTLPNVIALPSAAVGRRGDERVVFVVEDGKAKKLPVTLGLTSGTKVQVSGVPEGALVIVTGQDSVDEGTPVTIGDKK